MFFYSLGLVPWFFELKSRFPVMRGVRRCTTALYFSPVFLPDSVPPHPLYPFYEGSWCAGCHLFPPLAVSLDGSAFICLLTADAGNHYISITIPSEVFFHVSLCVGMSLMMLYGRMEWNCNISVG